jgi:hypothetical protein
MTRAATSKPSRLQAENEVTSAIWEADVIVVAWATAAVTLAVWPPTAVFTGKLKPANPKPPAIWLRSSSVSSIKVSGSTAFSWTLWLIGEYDSELSHSSPDSQHHYIIEMGECNPYLVNFM